VSDVIFVTGWIEWKIKNKEQLYRVFHELWTLLQEVIS